MTAIAESRVATQTWAAAMRRELDVADRGAVPQLARLLRALGAARHHRVRLGVLAAALVSVVCGVAYGQIMLNAWNGSFIDILARHEFASLGGALVTFLLIVSGLLLLVVSQTWLQEMIKVRLRDWLTHDLLDNWLVPKRPYLLAHAGEAGVNPDQYVQADVRQLAELSATLGFGLLQSTLLLGSFASVLWILSSQVTFTLDHSNYFNIPGYMVWCALIYAFAGSWLAWIVGRPLIHLNAERYAREADLRFALVRIHESAEAIALHGGEPDERRRMDGPMARVVSLSQQLANGVARLTWVTSGYGWLGLIVPVLVALPSYMFGDLSLGGLTIVVGAFNQVQTALKWFVDNVDKIADWRATLLRVTRFREGLLSLSAPADDAEQITIEYHPYGKLAFENFSLLLPDGRTVLDDALVEVDRGERVLIAGCSESDKTELLRAIAGLGSRGAGTILLPPAQSVMFMPPRPYLPLGSLCAAVTYPARAEEYERRAVCAALRRVGLDRLIPRLDETGRWDKLLSIDEQQRLALARLMLQAPNWVFFEGTTPCLNEEQCRLVRSIFADELPDTTVISIGDSPALRGFYTRTLHLRRLSAIVHPAAAAATSPSNTWISMTRARISSCGG